MQIICAICGNNQSGKEFLVVLLSRCTLVNRLQILSEPVMNQAEEVDMQCEQEQKGLRRKAIPFRSSNVETIFDELNTFFMRKVIQLPQVQHYYCSDVLHFIIFNRALVIFRLNQ